MKKTLLISILIAIVLIVCTTITNATTSSTMAEGLYTEGEKYGMTSADKVKIERYLYQNEVPDEQANQIITKDDETVASNNGKLAYTGNDSISVVLTTSIIAVITIAIIIGGKNFAYAKQ